MSGGAGNDSYVVDDVGDVLLDSAGVDTVFTSLTFTLAASFENLTLTGGGAVNGTGNGSANHLIGNNAANSLAGGGGNDLLEGLNGNDTLTGGAGADTMIGGIGADRYVVDNAGDVVIENPGEGADIIVATISYTLAVDIENLQFTGAANLAGAGNAVANRLSGNDGNNLLSGFGGNDNIIGGAGADTLVGGAGQDALTGGAGADWFLYESATQGSDKIVDFAPGVDAIAIEVAGFGAGLVAGALAAANFVAHASNATTSAAGTPQFVYNTATGVLFYDSDGMGGAASQRLAVLTGVPALTATDFILI
jgi:Ca2+-binding RTX toxin-like protein